MSHKKDDMDANLEDKNLDSLLTLYRWTLPQLRECALYQPDQSIKLDIEETELKLLSLQERIVRTAASYKVDNEKDIASLLELWHLVWSSEDNGPQLTDELILSLHERFVRSN